MPIISENFENNSDIEFSEDINMENDIVPPELDVNPSLSELTAQLLENTNRTAHLESQIRLLSEINKEQHTQYELQEKIRNEQNMERFSCLEEELRASNLLIEGMERQQREFRLPHEAIDLQNLNRIRALC